MGSASGDLPHSDSRFRQTTASSGDRNDRFEETEADRSNAFETVDVEIPFLGYRAPANTRSFTRFELNNTPGRRSSARRRSLLQNLS